MTTYYFLGSQSSIGDYGLLNRFGQSISLPEDFAAQISVKVPLLTKAPFDSVGFTSAELRQWAQPLSHDNAPKEFLAKKSKALDLWRKGGKLPEAPVVKEEAVKEEVKQEAPAPSKKPFVPEETSKT